MIIALFSMQVANLLAAWIERFVGLENIEHERAIVEGNRALIRINEEKFKKVIERVWEG